MKRRVLLVAFGAWACPTARALMAGDPPDAPSKRVDPNTANSPWTGVPSITVGDDRQAFGGVLVGARHVLTAAHVAAGVAAGSVHVNFNVQRALSHRIGAARITVHPFHKSAQPSASEVDLAVIELSADAPANARRYTIDTAPHGVGEPLAIVAYGASGFGAIGVSTSSDPGVKRIGTARIGRLVAGGVQARPWIYLWRFDAPGTAGAVPGQTGLATGDSGSPAFVRAGGEWRVYGINTFIGTAQGRKPSTFGTECGGQVVAPHMEWLRSVGV